VISARELVPAVEALIAENNVVAEVATEGLVLSRADTLKHKLKRLERCTRTRAHNFNTNHA
jgi:hypothetical protein